MLFPLGLLIGLVLALTGAGGAILAVPLLMFGMGWSLTQASPVALVAVASSAAVGAVLGLKAGIVRYRAAIVIALAGLPMAPLGLYCAHRVPLAPLTLVFAALLAWIAVRTFRQALRELAGQETRSHVVAGTVPCLIDPETGRFKWTGRCGRALSLAGMGTGFVSGLLGVGGGFIIVPTMRRFTDLPVNSIVATSTMVIALVSGTAAASAAFAGHLPGRVAAIFAAGAIGGMILGRAMASRIAGPRLQQGFAILTGGVAVFMAIRVVAFS